jgi:peptidoglycan/xylan/chitin deacetylase (PgdA/CDA1 family)
MEASDEQSPGTEASAAQARRLRQAQRRRSRIRVARVVALVSLLAVGGALAEILVSTTGGSKSHGTNGTTKQAGSPTGARTSTKSTPGKPAAATVPILAYRVINSIPPGSSADPRLYVPAAEFSAQMQALKEAGWHSVTLNQLEAYWTKGTSLGTSKPIVITFDDGYASQYTNALPVLKGLGWVGVENLRVNGLPPSEGGLTDAQVRGLIAAGWEVDTEGVSQADLTALSPTQVQTEVASARQTVQSTYNVPVNWFSYPSGDYDPAVVSAVRAAGFTGATTVVQGWASPQRDRFRLPRLQVLGGTSPSKLLSQIAATAQQTAIPDSFHSV